MGEIPPGGYRTTCAYDADKLTSIAQGGNTVRSYAYDAAGRTTAVARPPPGRRA